MSDHYLTKHLPPRRADRIEDPAKFSTEEVLGHYFKLIIKNANWWSSDPDEREDLISEGLLGVLEALHHFDAEKA